MKHIIVSEDLLPNIMLVTNAIHKTPTGGRELLCKLNYNILKDLYNDRCIVFELSKNYIIGIKSIINAFRGYIDGLSPESVALALQQIQAQNVDKIFVDGSNLGKFVKVVKTKFPEIQIYTFFHNVEARFFWGAFKQNPSPHSLAVLATNYLAERKSIAYALENIDKKDNFLLVQYERFIENPEIETRIICSFLDIDYEGEMVNPKKYVSKEGKQWKQNSSFGTSTKITNKFSEKWKEILTKDQIKFVENLCYPEMKLFNYERFISPGDFTNLPEFNIEIQDWIKKYSSEFDIGPREMKKEEIRKYHLDKSEESKKVFIIDDFIYKLKNY